LFRTQIHKGATQIARRQFKFVFGILFLIQLLLSFLSVHRLLRLLLLEDVQAEVALAHILGKPFLVLGSLEVLSVLRVSNGLCEAKITEQQLLRVFVHKDVVRLNISVHQAVAVNMLQSVHQLHEQATNLLPLKAVLSPRSCLDVFFQGLTICVLHLDHH